LVDSGTVERANIGYQDLYTKEWVGKAKVDAARAKLQELYPWAGITPKQLDFPNPGSSFEDLDSRIAEAESLVRQSVCCVCCFDTLSARLGAFLFSYLLKKPFVNAGVQDESGSIRTWIPDSAQACPACMLRKLPADNLGDGCVVAHPSISGIVASFAAAYTSRIVYGRHVPNITHVSLSASQTGFPVLLAESGEQDKNCRICSKAPEGSIVEWFTRIY
jgi:molybdopterin/thiamine biosynthesis adenylyltransferase